jgi:hypothetical protein
VGKVSFHHGESFFPPWWKEKTSTVERISIRRQRTKRWQGKRIKVPKKEAMNSKIFVSLPNEI